MDRDLLPFIAGLGPIPDVAGLFVRLELRALSPYLNHPA